MFEFLANGFNSYALIIGGIVIGIIGVVIGGSMFFSVPLIQVLFPGIPFGGVVGNIKVGSMFRGIGSTWSTRKEVDFKSNLLLSIPLLLGTIAGSSVIAKLDQKWIFPAIIMAVILAEISPIIANKISKKHFFTSSILIGIYAGFLGAGIGILLVALFRLKHPEDKKIAHAKIQARFIEWILVFVAVAVHALHNNLILKIWILWSIGTFIGGFLGGEILKRIGHLEGVKQKIILRISFAVAIGIAAWQFFT